MDTTQKSVWGSHSSSPSVKSWLQHHHLFADYIFVTLSTPSPPNHPSLRLLLFFLHLSPLSHPNSPRFYPTSSTTSSSSCNIRLISPNLSSQDLCFFSPPSAASPSTPPLPSSPVLFAPVYLHHSTRWFVLKLYIWQLGWFFIPWYYCNIGRIAQTWRNTEEGQAGGKRKLKHEKPWCIKSNYSVKRRAAVITGPFFGLVPCVTF